MSIKEALNWADKKIERSEAEILLAFLFKKDVAWLWAHNDGVLSKKQFEKFKTLIQRRSAGEPIAYLVGQKEFFGFDFYVDENVLIPRPETEILVEEALKEIRNRKEVGKIADIGTGSGCIGVAIVKKLKAKMSNVKIYATDISKKALELAKKNAKKHGVSNKITFLHGDLLDALPEKVDLVIANLPYVNRTCLKPKREPKFALDGGRSGLKLIKKLLHQAPKYLSLNGTILLEISPEQKPELKKFLSCFRFKSQIQFIKDFSNLDRVAKLTIA